MAELKLVQRPVPTMANSFAEPQVSQPWHPALRWLWLALSIPGAGTVMAIVVLVPLAGAAVLALIGLVQWPLLVAVRRMLPVEESGRLPVAKVAA